MSEGMQAEWVARPVVANSEIACVYAPKDRHDGTSKGFFGIEHLSWFDVPAGGSRAGEVENYCYSGRKNAFRA